nr:hypothetical protein [Escherichia coli]
MVMTLILVPFVKCRIFTVQISGINQHRINPVTVKKIGAGDSQIVTAVSILRGVGLEQRQHVHLARKSLVEAVNADQIPDLYGSHVPCLQATMHGLPVATRPKIKMVQLQFTPFASDDTYHWQNHDVTTISPTGQLSVSTGHKVVFVIEAAFFTIRLAS